MQPLGAVLLTVLLGALVHGQADTCISAPCQQSGVCVVKPNGAPFCECTESNEGEFCETPSVGACSDLTRNFYGAKKGIVTSQDFPSPYPNAQNCPYFIGAADSKKIEITFNFLQLEDGKDELAIGMGPVADFQIATYTFDLSEYNPLPEPIEMVGDRMWMNLFTDQNQQRMGFNISYRIDGDECTPNLCPPGEMCTDLEYSYTCTNIQTGMCTPNACQNNGVCSVTPAGAPYCACLEGFEGDYCQIISPGNCSDVTRNFYNQREGQIASPNFPMNYPNNEDCAYFIGAPDAKKIEFTFHSLGLQSLRDNLTIGSGPSVDSAAIVVSYSMPSGLPLPGPRTVMGNKAWLNLVTDDVDQNTGFNVTWRIDGDECLPKPCLPGETCIDIEFGFTCEKPIKLSCNPNPCKQNAVCDPKPSGSPYCQCPVNYQGDYCQTEVVSSCNDRNRNFYGQRQGVITSPGFPNPYPNNQDCSYFVGVPDAKKVEITINALGLEGVDELTIGNGSLADYRENLRAFGAEGLNATMGMPVTFEVPGDRAWLNLYTDVFNTRQGFSVNYRIDGDECLSNPCLAGQKCVDLEYEFACQVDGRPPVTTTAPTTTSATSSPAPVTNAPVITTQAPATTEAADDSESSEETGGASLGGGRGGGDDDDESQEQNGGGNAQRPQKPKKNSYRRRVQRRRQQRKRPNSNRRGGD
ncbi:tolloid-like protein 2 isoform X1 [Asterias amurensis]|uniref:tolloid-like protein 2 isoform X1 n=1 Tax=Asterias amurensis TaxID=7602 RepID=UPI003AB6D6E6